MRIGHHIGQKNDEQNNHTNNDHNCQDDPSDFGRIGLVRCGWDGFVFPSIICWLDIGIRLIAFGNRYSG